MRKPEENIQTYELGHWEVGQLALALEQYAIHLRMTGAPDQHIDATRDLGNVFSTGSAIFTLIKVNDPQ